MLKQRSFKLVGLITTLLLALMLSACSNGSDDTKSLGKKEIDIPYVASDNSTVRALVIAEVLEKVGYDVTTIPVQASGPLYATVSENSDSFHASGIFPSTDKEYYNKFKDDINVYDTNHFISDVKVGLAVPKYVEDINSISDLKDKEFGDSVDWKIQGTDARNGVMKLTKKELDSDDLKRYSLEEASDQTQFEAVQKAYGAEENIVFTGMIPSWFHKETDYKLLDDPNRIFGRDSEHIDLVFNKDFKRKHPAAYTIATRMADDWNQKDEEELAKKIFVNNERPEQVAKDYVEDNDNKVDDWLEGIERK